MGKLCETGTVKSRLKNKKCLSSQLNLKCQNKTEKNIIKNTTIKSIKQKNEKIESHPSHNSLSSIPYRSNDWSWNRTGIETIFSLSGNQLIQMSFSTLSFSPPENGKKYNQEYYNKKY